MDARAVSLRFPFSVIFARSSRVIQGHSGSKALITSCRTPESGSDLTTGPPRQLPGAPGSRQTLSEAVRGLLDVLTDALFIASAGVFIASRRLFFAPIGLFIASPESFMHACAHCHTPFTSNSRGRPKLFCSTSCSRAASRIATRPPEAETPPDGPETPPEPVKLEGPGTSKDFRRVELTSFMKARGRWSPGYELVIARMPDPEIERLLSFYSQPLHVG